MRNFESIIDQHIRRAQAEGAFDNLPGQGKPLNLDDGYKEAPEESRMAYKILKNAGYIPEEVQQYKDLQSLKSLIKETPEGDRKQALLARFNADTSRYYLALERQRRRK